MATRHQAELGPLMTTREVAARLRVSQDHVVRLALRGELPSLKVGSRPGQRGGRRLFLARDVDAWIAARVSRA